MEPNQGDIEKELVRRRRRSVLGKRERRAVVFFLTASALAAGLIALAGFLKREPSPLMPPETAEAAALRTSPNNAFPLIEEATTLLPTPPAPLYANKKDNAGYVGPFIPAPGSLGLLLKIGRPDGDPELAAYLAAAAPAVETMRRALEMPHFRLPTVYSHAQRDVVQSMPALATLAMAAGLYRIRTGAATDEYTTLRDVMRLGRLVDQDGGISVQSFAGYVQVAALHSAWDIALAPATPDQRGARLSELAELSLAAAPMKHHLEFEWRVLDRPDAYWILIENPEGATTASEDPEDFFERLFIGRAMNNLRRHVLENRHLYEEAAELPLTKMNEWQTRHPEHRAHNVPFDPMQGIMGALNMRATLEAWVRGLTAQSQLEAYRSQHGEYPATLGDAGVSVVDPFTDQPYYYRAHPGDFTLYSVGANRGDNGGDPNQDRDIVIHRAAVEDTQDALPLSLESFNSRRGRSRRDR